MSFWNCATILSRRAITVREPQPIRCESGLYPGASLTRALSLLPGKQVSGPPQTNAIEDGGQLVLGETGAYSIAENKD